MKQFQWLSHVSGYTHGPYSLHTAISDYAPDADAHDHLDGLQVGSSWTDRAGDVWTRLPDSPEADLAVEPEAARDGRLERIATAVLTGLASVPNNSLNLTPDDVRRLDVESAVKYAKALIAELDKPA